MSKSFTKCVVLLLVMLLLFVFWGCKQKLAEKPKPVMPAISVKELAPAKVVYLERQGPYSETDKSFEELFTLMEKKNIQVSGAPMGIFYDDPEKVKPEETKYEVMCSFTGDFNGDADLQVKEQAGQKVVSTIYIGPYEKCAPTYKKLYGWMMDNKYEVCGASIEKYLNDPMKVKPEELKTEICIPVKAATEEEKTEGE